MSLFNSTIEDYLKRDLILIFKEVSYTDRYKRTKGVRKYAYLKNIITGNELRINKKNIQELEESIKHPI